MPYDVKEYQNKPVTKKYQKLLILVPKSGILIVSIKTFDKNDTIREKRKRNGNLWIL